MMDINCSEIYQMIEKYWTCNAHIIWMHRRQSGKEEKRKGCHD